MNEKGLCGMNNLGNTCYLNSILQCLFHCKKFVIYILDNKDKLIEGLLYEFYELLNEIWFSDNKIISPSQFINQLKENHIFYRNSNQQDSHECLITILDDFECELLNNNIKISGNLEWYNNNDIFKTNKQNFMQEIFYGLYQNKVICEHNHVSITKEPFIDLSLPCIKGKNIEELIENIEQKEIMHKDNKYFCDKCKNYVCAEKNTIIEELPKYNLIIHLKRFENNTQKINDFFEYPFKLEIKEKIYHLFGVVNHTGNQIGGHYYSYIKHIDNEWYEMNDSRVDKISDINKIVNTNAYILFYQLE